MPSNAASRAVEAFREHGGFLRTQDALGLGIHPRTLYALRDNGTIDQLSRGVYRLGGPGAQTNPDLTTVALRMPRAIICLVSALAYHDATDEVPHEVQIALPRGTKAPRIDHPPLRVFWFSGFRLSAGVQIVRLDGVDVRIYDLAKTVVDCFRFRNKLGTDVAVDALAQAVRRKGVPPSALLHYARLCRIETVMLPYIRAVQ